jgi:hypothetical protein
MAADPRLARGALRTQTPPQPPPPPPPLEPMRDSRPPATPDVAQDEGAEKARGNEEAGFKLKFCTVCASNQNR